MHVCVHKGDCVYERLRRSVLKKALQTLACVGEARYGTDGQCHLPLYYLWLMIFNLLCHLCLHIVFIVMRAFQIRSIEYVFDEYLETSLCFKC